MAITLLDVARNKKDAFEAAVVETWADRCDILKKLPLKTIGTLEVHTRRRASGTMLGFRKRGQAYGDIKGGGYDIVSDAVYPMGGNIDIDKADMRDKAPASDPLTERIRDGIDAAAATFNYYFINGDHAIDEDTFEGIKVRLAASPAAQTVYGNSSTTALDVAGAIAANNTAVMQTFLDRIDDAIYACDGHTADIALCNAEFIRALKAVLRRLNLYKDVEPTQPYKTARQSETSATYNNSPIFNWNGVDFYDMGVQVDNVTKVIGTETVGGEATQPVYFLKLGDRYLHGIQQYAMEVTKPTLLPDNVTYRVTIDWPVGLRHVHPRSFSKLAGVKV